MLHDWTKSNLGHGEVMCKNCMITNREAAVLGKLNDCEEARITKTEEIVSLHPSFNSDADVLNVGNNDKELAGIGPRFKSVRFDWVEIESVVKGIEANPEKLPTELALCIAFLLWYARQEALAAVEKGTKQ